MRVGFDLLDKLYLVLKEPFRDDASTILLTDNGLPRWSPRACPHSVRPTPQPLHSVWLQIDERSG